MRLALSLLLALSAFAAHAQDPATPTATTRNTGDAAHLFGYIPKPGMEAQFDAGYRKHLEWHRAHRDPLVWYGWYVTHGPRMGTFIDGSFGAPFAAFDQRVSPADDAKDNERTFLPYAQPVFRSVYRVRRDLSTATPLEQWTPTALLEVHTYRVKPGKAYQFEQIAKRVRTVTAANHAKGIHTWYEGVGGTGTKEYVLMVAREGFAAYDTGPADLESVLSTIEDATARRELLSGYAAAIDEIGSEIWRYRSDLSLIPSE